MSFTIIECEQRTPEWFAAKTGVVGASDAKHVVAVPKKGSGELVGKNDLRVRKAMEVVYGTPIEEDNHVTPWMQRGIDLEEEGLSVYEVLTGELLQRVGFLKHDTLPIGCSPDSIVGDYEGGLELKCPKFTTHYAYLQLNGAVPSEYLPQLTHSLLVSDLPFWEFVSYSPDFQGAARIYRARLTREDVNLAAYELAFRLFWNEVETVMEDLRARSAA